MNSRRLIFLQCTELQLEEELSKKAKQNDWNAIAQDVKKFLKPNEKNLLIYGIRNYFWKEFKKLNDVT